MSFTVISNIGSTFIQIFVMLAIGFVMRKKGVMDDHVQNKLSTLLTAGILPFSIIDAAFYEITDELVGFMKLILGVSMIYYMIAMVLVLALTHFFPIRTEEKRCFWTASVFANTSFVGLPLVMQLYTGSYGSVTILLVLMYNISYQLFFYSLGYVALSKEKNIKKAVLHVFTEPLFICCIISLVIFGLRLYRFVPDFVKSTTSTISAAMIPISMIIIGSSLATIKVRELLTEKYAYMVSFMRLILFPLAMLIVLKLLHMESDAAQILVIMTALPAGSLTVIYAEQYHCAPEFATKCVVQSTVFMVITLPLFVLLAQLVL